MSREQRRPLAALALVLGVVLAAYCLTFATAKVTNDAASASIASWRIAQTGTPYLEGSGWERFDRVETQGRLWVGEAENGHEVAFRSPGPIAAGVPAYLTARAVGVDDFSIVPGSAVAAVLTSLALGLIFCALRPRAGTRVAAIATFVLAFTTPVWSVSADSLWTHPVTLLGIGGMAWASVRERWWLVGVFGGIAVWGRLHTAIIVALLGLGLSLIRRQPRIALTVGAVSCGFLTLSFLWGRWTYGTWSPAGGYSVDAYAESATSTESVLADVVNHLGLWVAPDRGILLWTPVLVLLLPAVVRAWGRLPDWSRLLAIGGVVYTLIQGQLNGFSGGSNFYGYRLTLELLVCSAPAFVLAVPDTRRVARVLLGPLIGLQLAVISLGAAQDGGVLGEEVLWTGNSFVHLIAGHPVLVVWPALLMTLGLLVGRRLGRSAPCPEHEPREPEVEAAAPRRDPTRG